MAKATVTAAPILHFNSLHFLYMAESAASNAIRNTSSGL